jgi:2,5-diketo-D-gluconate reductase B
MSDSTLPPIGIGTYDVAPDDCREAVQYALNEGYRHVDTAEMYENESAVGDAIDAADVARDEVFVSTKAHSTNLADGDLLEHARRSRDRLGVETIDLLYVHWPIRSYDPEATLAAMDRLHDEGLTRHVGLSNFTPELLEAALDRLDAPLYAHQIECHPLLPQTELRELAREHGHYLVAYSPLAKGQVFDVPELVEIADRHDATAAQVSLAWLLSKERVRVIPKSTSRAHIRENRRARGLQLTDEEIRTIDELDERVRQVDFPEAPWN